MSIKVNEMPLIWVAVLVSIGALLAPTTTTAAEPTKSLANATSTRQNSTSRAALDKRPNPKVATLVGHQAAESSSMFTKMKPYSLGDSVDLDTARNGHMDLVPAAGEHKKYILVKKKPKHKKIKMDVYKPVMKYKKIKMKVPVKKLKKKKVKGYLVKKEHGHHGY